MNNKPNTERDPLIADALERMGEAPEHGSDFWTQLEGSLEAETSSSTGSAGQASRHLRNRFRFRVLASAAALLVVGLVGVSMLNDRGSEFIAVDLLEPATTAPPLTQQPSLTTAPPVTFGNITSVPSGADINVPLFSDRAESALFLYDVPVPPGFTVNYATGRGVTESLVGETFDGSIETRNFSRLDPTWFDEPVASDYGELLSTETVRVPLYERTASGLVDEGVFLDVEQFTYQLEGSVRVERIYNFNDRSISASVTLFDAVADDYSAQVILDDIRMYNAAFVPIDIAACSTLGDVVPETPEGLTVAQAARFEGIVQALVACNWEALESQLDPGGFLASFGGGDPIELWQGAERYDEPMLEQLLDHMRTMPGFSDDGAVAWPRPQLLFWEEVTDEMKQELLSLGYTEDDFVFFEEIGYTGYRTGFDAEGNWQYFVAGD